MAAVVLAVAEVDYRDKWWWHLMVVAALDSGQAITSRRRERAAICGIVYSRATTGMARNKAMAVALDKEGNSKGKKCNGNCNKVGDGKQRR